MVTKIILNEIKINKGEFINLSHPNELVRLNFEIIIPKKVN